MGPVRGLGPYSLRPIKISDSTKTEGKRKRKIQRVIVPHASDKYLGLEKELLPGIDNQVTLENIASRMQWMTLQTLSSVSRAWQQATGDRLTHEARVRTNSGETFVVVNNITRPGDANGIAFFSLRDCNVYYQLPPIPKVGIPWGSQCATLDGKVYIFGGSKYSYCYCGSRDVYVFDLAGRKHWQQCAKMQEGRRDFGCGVKDGKIYVIGGCRTCGTCGSQTAIAAGAEVYDPQEDAWSSIKPMPCSWTNWNHLNLKVATVGGELHVYYGQGTCKEYWAYNPVMDDWRTIVTNFGMNTAKKSFFMSQGKLCPFYVTERVQLVAACPIYFTVAPRVLREVLEVDGEYLAIVKHANGIRRLTRPRRRGPGSNNIEDFVLEMVCNISFGYNTFMCPIQL